jgi:hypothetical protein
MAMPTRTCLVVIKAELVFCGLEAILDRPAMAFDYGTRASDTSRPLLGFPVVGRAAADPVLRQTTAVFAPASCSRKIPDDLLFREPHWLHVNPPPK